jgi:hypothetical protein
VDTLRDLLFREMKKAANLERIAADFRVPGTCARRYGVIDRSSGQHMREWEVEPHIIAWVVNILLQT